MPTFDSTGLIPLRHALENHPIYKAIRTVDHLRIFMSHHVFSVWDFMSVVKYLQQQVAPSSYPWVPHGNPQVRYFVNQLVLEEESDMAPPDELGNPSFASHFELYCRSMEEIGADPSVVLRFAQQAAEGGIESAFALGIAPQAAQQFVKSTFECMATDEPHRVAAAFAMGREHIIPGMFRAFLQSMGITEKVAPTFFFYLKRHIHLDSDFHGPISLMLLNALCAGDSQKILEAEQSASAAIRARICFWDGVCEAF